MPRVRIPIRYNPSPITIRAWIDNWREESLVNWEVDWNQVDCSGTVIKIPFNGGNIAALEMAVRRDVHVFDHTIVDFVSIE
ncbi:hypothetical protein [Photorhabdus heterorhabditis]|uniref:Uncharacterized protein n=1 Tax=Photorhabdus heterorhabditis TaxID=880156 RepID=A0ABR5KFD7_9GAMM|nr:hypothetical protein [Photorhabdus heterorhabditis]KOY63140.1 hypothetical protein AM629_04315 [Photorhabdus heterorhabditis]MBS9441688.1 hypothetical protein [Photorhabdus heterorhabditis]